MRPLHGSDVESVMVCMAELKSFHLFLMTISLFPKVCESKRCEASSSINRGVFIIMLVRQPWIKQHGFSSFPREPVATTIDTNRLIDIGVIIQRKHRQTLRSSQENPVPSALHSLKSANALTPVITKTLSEGSSPIPAPSSSEPILSFLPLKMQDHIFFPLALDMLTNPSPIPKPEKKKKKQANEAPLLDILSP
ncbi:hypothetical protein Dimus_015459 [Dionaea muscipula]